jgi:hypothetical protein
MFPKVAYFALAGLVCTSSMAVAAPKEEVNCGLPATVTTDEEYFRWMIEQLRKVKPEKQSTSMMYLSPDTVQQVIERKLFKTGVVQDVAERQFLGKSAEEADKILRNSGFRSSFAGDERSYHWDEPPRCFVMVLATIEIDLQVKNRVVTEVDAKVHHISF